jgi:hypothetical protein
MKEEAPPEPINPPNKKISDTLQDC